MADGEPDQDHRRLRAAIHDQAARFPGREGLAGVKGRIGRRRSLRRVRLAVAGAVVVVVGVIGAVAAMSGPPELETVAPPTSIPATTITLWTTTSLVPTDSVPSEIPPCEEDVIPEDRTPTAENTRPFPTYVPQYHFVGLRFDEVACQAELNGVQLRLWKWDGEELGPEGFGGGGVVNLVVVDFVVTEAAWAPPFRTTTVPVDPPPTTHPPTTQSAAATTIPASETTVGTTARPLPGPTFVPEYNFVGLALADAQTVADDRSLILRVWKIDGEEVLPEAFGQGAVNIELVGGIVTVAVWSPTP